jgi:hypothetical protein
MVGSVLSPFQARAFPVAGRIPGGVCPAGNAEEILVVALVQRHGDRPEAAVIGHERIVGLRPVVEGAQEVDAVRLRQEEGEIDILRGNGANGKRKQEREAAPSHPHEP